ncbi:AAA family ATPase [Spirochaeta cellobiosiphila]|uniref:AAA family ATPase n=1 Tax=Spirochaeta cellobiosiphila TaxID=504483 RepID=UPI0004208649|nr:AAA family ATPase [Spirochaeta cellobiosiphila]
MDLFQSNTSSESEPLAARMRPRNLSEYIGQEHIVGEGRLLRRAIQVDRLSSVLFYGPPGTGKTTLARVIAGTTKSRFVTVNAVLSGVKEIREAIKEAKDQMNFHNRKTILFVDEVHRWNKAQQDALLPWVENGTFILIGATTENPYFEVNSALVSRSRVFQLVSLTDEDLMKIAHQALKDKERGYGKLDISFEEGALEHIVKTAAGDARSLLGALELAVESSGATPLFISMKAAEESIQKKVVLYDKEGDYHYDTISAFIKSLRGSDPDAALYWLARMVRAGEDPKFLFRRMLISASEDVGLADPRAISIVSSAASAFDRVGMPEGQFFMAEAALYLATAPKSNSSLGYFDALKSIEAEELQDIPNHLKDSSRDKHAFGHGEDYKYPHAFKDHWVSQAYLPENLRGRLFYKPSKQGYEHEIREEVLRKREAALAAMQESRQEVLTYTKPDKNKEQWFKRTQSGQRDILYAIRDKIFEHLSLQRHDRLLIIKESTGLLLWEALRKVPEGGVTAYVTNKDDLAILNAYASSLDEPERPLLLGEEIKELDQPYDALLFRDLFTDHTRWNQVLSDIHRWRKENTKLVFSQVWPLEGQRLSDLSSRLNTSFPEFKEWEDGFYQTEHPLFWTIESLQKAFQEDSMELTLAESLTIKEERFITEEMLQAWLIKGGSNKKGLAGYLQSINAPVEDIYKLLADDIVNRPVTWNQKQLIFKV